MFFVFFNHNPYLVLVTLTSAAHPAPAVFSVVAGQSTSDEKGSEQAPGGQNGPPVSERVPNQTSLFFTLLEGFTSESPAILNRSPMEQLKFRNFKSS